MIIPIYKDSERDTYYVSCYYKTWDGKQKRKVKRGFKLIKEARLWEAQFLNEAGSSPDMHFEQLISLFLKDKHERIRQNTYNGYVFIIDTLILPYFKDMKICDIQAMHIRRWQNEMLGRSYSQMYLKRMATLMSNIFNYACQYYGLQTNPCRTAGSIGKWKSKGIGFWTIDEFTSFISSVPQSETYIAFQVLYWTGMRIGEMLALTPADVDFEEKTISITKSLQRIKRKDVITPPKTPKSERVIFIHDELAYLLRNHLHEIPHLKPDARIFPFTTSRLYGAMKSGCELSGVKKIKLHDLRHSHASLLIELNFAPLLIAERLGHENVSTTLNIYSHLYPDKQTLLIEKLQEQNLRCSEKEKTVS